MVKKHKPLRYIEISRRNPVTKILVGSGTTCNPGSSCGDICIEIRRAGQSNCNPMPSDCPDNPCCSPEPLLACPTFVARVCALDLDDRGYAIFEWPKELYDIKEGWYEGHLTSGCFDCAVLPIRVGPRCNVIEVETEISGPDSKCWVGCEDECLEEICATKPATSTVNQGKTIYIPDYNVG